MNKKDIGARCATLRQKAGLSKRQVSIRCGWHCNRPVDAIESGTTAYTIDNLITYLGAVGGKITIR